MIRRISFTLLLATALFTGLHAQCHLFDLVVTASECENGHFNISLDFEYDNVGNHGFKVVGNGVNYGTFEYADLPVQIGPLAGNGTTDYEFVVMDVDFPDCSDFYLLGTVDCPTTGDCEISNLVLEPGPCNPDGTYKLWINFAYQNAPNSFFEVFYQGENLGFFPLADLPVHLPNFDDNGNPHPVVVVCINDAPDCCAEADFTAPQCNPCEISDLVATAGDCQDGMFYVTLDFEFANTSGDGFKVKGNGINYGIFAYDDLPVQIGPLAGNGVTTYEFAVFDVAHPDCHSSTVLGIVECPSTGDCDLFDAVADPLECNNDGTYSLAINFQVTNAGNNFFFVKYKGETVVPHAPIANLPYIIEHFEDDGNPEQAILICINDQPGCCAEVTFESLNCPPPSDCHIYEVIAEAHECEDGHFLVDIAFEHDNTGSEGFTIFGNGVNYGTFDYGQPFYTIGPLAGNGTVYEFVIKDLEHPDCKGFTHLPPVYCDDFCHIYGLTATVTDCNDENQFYVTLNFEHSGTGNDGFKVVGNGNVYGFFNYDELPIVLGPFETDLDVLEFAVNDVAHPDCHDFVEVHTPNCSGGGDCHLFNLSAEVHPCLPNGTFYVSLDFGFTNTSGYFKVHGNGIQYGVFSYNDLPVSIGPLAGNGLTPYEFAVTDVHFDCSDAVEVGPVSCDPAGACEVFDLVADPGVCHSDDSYNLWVNFSVNNPGSNFYDVFLNGQHIAFYSLAHVPVVIPHLPASDEPNIELTVCVNDHPDCCATVVYENPMCQDFNPVWPGDANVDFMVNHLDVLNLGLSFGNTGAARPATGVDWTGMESENWSTNFAGGPNYKHADCNGDGSVGAGDVEAVLLNYGQTHDTPNTSVFLNGDETDPTLLVDLPDDGLSQDGLTFSAPILFGTETHPADGVYGLAFTLYFDSKVIGPESVQINYDASWLGTKGSDLIVLDRKYPDDGRIEIVLVRNDGTPLSGFGEVAKFIGIIDNIAGREATRLSVGNVKAIGADESLIPVRWQADETPILTATTEVAGHQWRIYPNPARDWVQIIPTAGVVPESYSLRNLDGKHLAAGPFTEGKISLEGWPQGVYILQLQAGERLWVERIVKL